jgi:enoyl-CoA hydratase/carnithine racemase
MTEWNKTQENEHAFISETDGVITAVLNRPEKLNAISPPITDFLWRGAEEFGTDEQEGGRVRRGIHPGPGTGGSAP